MTIQETAKQFFEACETGKGWEICKNWCHPDASFSAQANALADITTLDAYCEWMKGLLVPIADGHYELKGMSFDLQANLALAYAVFHGTHTVDGPVPATNKTVASDYVYSIEFQDGKIRHMTKIWNDTHALTQLAWT